MTLQYPVSQAPAKELTPEEQAVNNEAAEKAKARGNDFLRAKQYDEAVAAYTEVPEIPGF